MFSRMEWNSTSILQFITPILFTGTAYKYKNGGKMKSSSDQSSDHSTLLNVGLSVIVFMQMSKKLSVG